MADVASLGTDSAFSKVAVFLPPMLEREVHRPGDHNNLDQEDDARLAPTLALKRPAVGAIGRFGHIVSQRVDLQTERVKGLPDVAFGSEPLLSRCKFECHRFSEILLLSIFCYIHKMSTFLKHPTSVLGATRSTSLRRRVSVRRLPRRNPAFSGMKTGSSFCNSRAQ